ncbi:hypothetical protein BDY24DRAFT_389646 [Mrakia frigida]|uniref:uncharacterized protein n=1 Tax=Mrakia frigida TaxID=29902 RepID=UPI003FCC0A3C
MSEPGFLSSNRYGKDKVRVCRVVRTPASEGSPAKQDVVEYVVRALLEGDVEESYTKADNASVVATDTVKNTVYILAKTSPHVLTPELFALHLALHFVTKYPHIHKSFVDIESLRWSRIDVEGLGPHPHSFLRDGEEKKIISVSVDSSAGKDKIVGTVKSGLQDLLVLKSGGSSFTGFFRDENTTLPEVEDRIFSTSVTLSYDFVLPPNVPLTIDSLPEVDAALGFTKTAEAGRKTTLEVFATDDSASVQATLYKAAQTLLTVAPSVSSVSYSLPNKHYMFVLPSFWPFCSFDLSFFLRFL